MKGNITSILVPFLILNVCAGRVFDEKSEAKKEIDVKFKEAVSLGNTTLKSAGSEKSSVTNKGEEELKKYLYSKMQEAKIEFEKDASAVIRTAIVQAKPVSVIYCIRNAVFFGTDTINEASVENLKKVLEVKSKKLEKIDFDVYAIKAIINGLKELVEQAITKINEGSGVIQSIKKEALNRCDSAVLLLGEIEVCLHEPILSKEYAKTRQNIDRNIKNMNIKLNENLMTCLK